MMGHVSSRKRMGILLPALVVLLGLLFWLSGCASQKELSLLQRQIWANHSQLEKNQTEVVQLEKSMSDRFGELNKRFEEDRQPLRRNQAAVGAQLDRIELEVGRLNGQLEEVAAMNGRQDERLSQFQERQMTTISEMRKSVDDLERRLSLVASYLGLQELAVSSTKTTSPGQQSTAQEKAPVQKAPSAAEDLYGNAFKLFRAGKFNDARTGFTTYLEKYSKTDLADNAQFWLGECYYAEKKYREAISAYQKTIKKYPRSDKVSSAMLKQGMAFLELGEKTAGKILLKKVVKGYPDSNQAKIAQAKLARIK